MGRVRTQGQGNSLGSFLIPWWLLQGLSGNLAFPRLLFPRFPFSFGISGCNAHTVRKITGYYVEELGMTGKPIAVTYKVNNETATQTCESATSGTITIINTDTTGSVEVSKVFVGLTEDALPSDFVITAEWPDGTTTTDSESGTATQNKTSVQLKVNDAARRSESGVTITKTKTEAENPTYIWTITGLPVGTTVTFTEAGYSVAGYTWIGTVIQNGGTETNGTEGTATVSGETTLPNSVKVACTNTYTPGVELPATGGHGTAIYTVAGLMLVTLAGVLMINRRKKYNR